MKYIENVVVTGISGYECVAMVAHNPRIPPITHLARRLPKPVRIVLIVLGAVWLARDFEVF